MLSTPLRHACGEMFLKLFNKLIARVLSGLKSPADTSACFLGGGGPQIGEVTCGGSPHLTCKRDHIKMRDYMDTWVTPRLRVTSPTWGSPPP